MIALLPALKSPTVSKLFGEDGFAVETVVAKSEINTLIPALHGRRRDRHHRAADRQDRPVRGRCTPGGSPTFDDHVGRGEIEARGGMRFPFHCTAIADGTRTIAADTPVKFRLVTGSARRAGSHRDHAPDDRAD